jgi:hypothetical protein
MEKSSARRSSHPRTPTAHQPRYALETPKGCQRLGDTLRHPRCPITDLVLEEAAAPLHVFECLPYNTTLESLDLTNARTIDESGVSTPLGRSDYQYLMHYLQERPLALSHLHVPMHALSAEQMGRLAHKGTRVLTRQPAKAAAPGRSSGMAFSRRGVADRRPERPLSETPVLPQEPQPPEPADIGHLALSPLRLAEELNRGRADSVLRDLAQCHQRQALLTGQRLTKEGALSLTELIRLDALGQIESLDLRGCEVDERGRLPQALLAAAGTRKVSLDELWLDTQAFGVEQWPALSAFLSRCRIRHLVLSVVSPSSRKYLQWLVSQAQAEHWPTTIWMGRHCLYRAPAPETTAAPPVLKPEELHLALTTVQGPQTLLRGHLSLSGQVLRFPLNHLTKEDADHLARVLTTLPGDIDALDLSHCTYAPAPLLGDRRGALLRVLKQVSALRRLSINAEALSAADWAELGTLLEQGRIGRLSLMNASDKAIARATKLMARVQILPAPPTIDWESRKPRT